MSALEALKSALEGDGIVRYHEPGTNWHGEPHAAHYAIRDEGDFTIDGFEGVFEYIEGDRVGSDFDSYRVVLKHGDSYYAVYGSYSSWDGVDFSWPEVEEVERKEVTKVVWSRKA